jgi:hypothetical protein
MVDGGQQCAYQSLRMSQLSGLAEVIVDAGKKATPSATIKCLKPKPKPNRTVI